MFSHYGVLGECKNWAAAAAAWWKWGEFRETNIIFMLDWQLFFFFLVFWIAAALCLCHFAQKTIHLTCHLTCAEAQRNCQTAALYFHNSVLNPKWGKKINLSIWQRPESGVIPICVNVIRPETQFNITFFFPLKLFGANLPLWAHLNFQSCEYAGWSCGSNYTLMCTQ